MIQVSNIIDSEKTTDGKHSLKFDPLEKFVYGAYTINGFPMSRYDTFSIVNGKKGPQVDFTITSCGQPSARIEHFDHVLTPFVMESDGPFSVKVDYTTAISVSLWHMDEDDEDEDDDIDAKIAAALKDRPDKIKCECGAGHVRHARHSDYCPLFEQL